LETQAFNVLAMLHLVMLSMWGGVVATEAVIEIYPFRQRELHPATIRFHYWIDLLVELPLVLAVIATGVALFLLTDPLTPLHLVKIGLGGAAVAVNLVCIVVVVRRGKMLERHPDRVVRMAVSGMLPKNRLGRKLIRKLKVYAGPDHPHQAQAPTTVEVASR